MFSSPSPTLNRSTERQGGAVGTIHSTNAKPTEYQSSNTRGGSSGTLDGRNDDYRSESALDNQRNKLARSNSTEQNSRNIILTSGSSRPDVQVFTMDDFENKSSGDLNKERLRVNQLKTLNVDPDIKQIVSHIMVAVMVILNLPKNLVIEFETFNSRSFAMIFYGGGIAWLLKIWDQIYKANDTFREQLVKDIVYSTPCDKRPLPHQGPCCFENSRCTIIITRVHTPGVKFEIKPTYPDELYVNEHSKTIKPLLVNVEQADIEFISNLITVIQYNYKVGKLDFKVIARDNFYEVYASKWRSVLNWRQVMSIIKVNEKLNKIQMIDLDKSGMDFNHETFDRRLYLHIHKSSFTVVSFVDVNDKTIVTY